MQYEMMTLQEKQVVGLGKRTTNEKMQAVTDISATWQEFMENGSYTAIKNKVDNRVIGLYTEYEGDFTKPYSFIAGCEVNKVGDIPDSLTLKTIPAGKYAKFTVRGHREQAVGEMWQKIWAMDLDRIYTCDFEVYHQNSNDVNDQIIDIYIAVK